MKKFNPNKELEKIHSKKKSFISRSTLCNMYVPLLVIGCSCLALLGATFSLQLTNDDVNEYMVRVAIINGNEDSYIKTVKEGAFSATITSDYPFGSIECSSGELTYDALTSTLSSPNIHQNTTCVLAFMDSDVKKLQYTDLNTTYDESGLAYYYNANADNNYLRIRDMLFRIIRINGDGTYRILLNDAISSSSYGTDVTYETSLLKKTLDDWYNQNFANESYVVEGIFDTLPYEELEDGNLVHMAGYSISYVGTLSAKEVLLLAKEGQPSYLKTMNGLALMNSNGSDQVYAYRDGEVVLVSLSDVLTVKPVMNIQGELIGSGTMNDPYTLK